MKFSLAISPVLALPSLAANTKEGNLRHLIQVPLNKAVIQCTPENPCVECQGDCKSDGDCQGDLVCYKKIGRAKSDKDATVPGCVGLDFSKTDWCVSPTSSATEEVVAEQNFETQETSSSTSSNDSCSVDALSSQGMCDRPSGLRLIVNSCGDIVGPTVVERAMKESGQDISTYTDKETFSLAWAYMESLQPTNVLLVGDNVYNDYIANWGAGTHPYGNNLATILTDASVPFLQYHGYVTEEGFAGPIFYSYLELLKDKLQDGYLDNEAFLSLKASVNNAVHVTWDDHDYLTNDPSNPHYLRHEFRKAEIETLTGWDRNYFRFGPSHMGIERTWTQELRDNDGNPFLVRFIFLDEETTHQGGQGCTYYYNPESTTGFSPRLTKDSSAPCPDMDVIEDFDQEDPERVFFGDDQLNWFKEQLMKPADLTFVINGGPNFEIDYAYNSLSEFPAEKRKLIQLLRETGAEHVIFMAGDSHATYVTKTPNIVGYPLYTIVGSGLTQGLSYDRYIGYWGDISHRFLVAAGSTHNNNAAASFAEVQVLFDDEGALVRFTPHLRDGLEGGDGWGPWYKQTEGFDDEPWDAQYEIRVSDLEIASDWPRYHYDSSIEHKFVTETIYLKWTNTTGPAEEIEVTLTITNAKGETETFPLITGTNCGENFFGFCKDVYGAFTYTETKVGTYAPSKENQRICEHAGYVGDTIEWSIEENGEQVADGTTTLSFRNTVLVNSDGELEDLHFYGTQDANNSVKGESVGVPVNVILNEPELYGGFSVPVKGWDGEKFDNENVQTAYEAFLAAEAANATTADTTELQATYLSTYYPDLPQL
ncbi:PhoD-like phosphatase [Nitzschia inconspicua]|uniref:PhoD-like phosphatase n=1 Tax=Nitzschia inconspicua TaxID=303405 RepID=A0A9K3PGK1_9STRA|nr:PhoD-like phosphatase [Nitzschia inconspicua]